MKKILIAATAVLFSSHMAFGQAISNLPSVEGAVDDTMDSELGDIITNLPGRPGSEECICWELCEILAALTSGQFNTQSEAETAVVTSLIQDRTNGIIMGLKNDGKFDPSQVKPNRVTLKYSDDFNVEATVKLLKAAGKAVLR